jgi:hypothetical protein
MSLRTHAEHEMKLAGLDKKDSDYGGMLYGAVLDLIDVFAKQGHSGCSASMVSNIFNKLSRYENLTPLTGKDEEWNDVGEDMWQNNRVSSVFKDKDKKPYYLDAIVWKTQTGSTWGGSANKLNGEVVGSRQFIKSFPFIPKTFYIDVIEKEISKGNWEFTIKDEKQLEKVFEYYTH